MVKLSKIWVLFLIIMAMFFIAESRGLNDFDPGDEHVYIYMGKMVSEGNMPYQDFFNSHPPLHIFMNSFLYRIFGFQQFIFKLLPLIAVIASSFFLFRLVLEKFGKIEAFASIILFLSSLEVLKFSTYGVGINITMFFVVSGIYYLYKNKHMVSGLLFGLAGITGIYSLPALIIILPILFFNNKAKFIKFSKGFLITFGITNIILLIFAGSSFFTSVYLYHLLKPVIEGSNIFLTVVKANILLFILPLTFFWSKNKDKLSVMFAIIIIYLLFFSMLGRIFKFYFLIIFPIMAIVGGVAFVNLIKKIKKEDARKFLTFTFLLIVILLGIKNAVYVNQVYFDEFEIKEDMTNYIIKNSEANEKIFGDISIVPMMALLSNRDIALNMVDTNKMVFESGVVNLKQTLEELDKENLKFIIIRPFTELATIDEFNEYINDKCVVAEQFKDKYYADFFLLDCSGE